MTKFTEFYVHPSEVVADEVVRICAEVSEGEADAYRLAQAEDMIRQFSRPK